MSHPINIKIHGENPDLIVYGEAKAGTVTIRPRTLWDCTQIEVKLLYRSKGKLAPQKYVIDQQRLIDSETRLLPGEVYEYDFELTQHNSAESYNGKNASVMFSIAVEAIMGGKEENEGLLAKISNKLAGQRRIKTAKSLKAENKNKLKISGDDESGLSLGHVNFFTLGIILLLCLLTGFVFFAYYQKPLTESFWGWAVGGLIVNILLGIGLQKLILRSLIGRFKMFPQHHGDDGFFVTIESQKAWQSIREAHCHYRVVEKVVDTRGTSDSTYRKTLFESPAQLVEQDHFGESKLAFTFPDINIPYIKVDNVSFEWEVVLKLKTSFGLKLKYTGAFKVKK